MIIAIDPGLNGGIAWEKMGKVDCEKLLQTLPEQFEQIRMLTHTSRMTGQPVRCYLEEVHAMPKQGVTSVWTFAQGFGRLEAILYSLGIETTLVRPQVWQKVAGLARQPVPKDATPAQKARLKAKAKNDIKELVGRRFPKLKPTLATADALGILLYAKVYEAELKNN